jgi:hypothetical protein
MRVGMRWWFGGIAIAWGAVAALTSLVNNAQQVRHLRRRRGGEAFVGRSAHVQGVQAGGWRRPPARICCRA